MSKIKITSSAVVKLMNLSRKLPKQNRLELFDTLRKSDEIITSAYLERYADGEEGTKNLRPPTQDPAGNFEEQTMEMDIPLHKGDVIIDDFSQVPTLLKGLVETNEKLSKLTVQEVLSALEIISSAMASGDRAMSAHYISSMLEGLTQEGNPRTQQPGTRKLEYPQTVDQNLPSQIDEPLSPEDQAQLENLTMLDEEDIWATENTTVNPAGQTRVRSELMPLALKR